MNHTNISYYFDAPRLHYFNYNLCLLNALNVETSEGSKITEVFFWPMKYDSNRDITW